jgi:hypothetical protein
MNETYNLVITRDQNTPTTTLKSVAEIIDFRETLEPSTAVSSIFTPPTEQWAFRGQTREFGALTPSFQRQFSKKSIGTARLIEVNLISAFRQHYQNLSDHSLDMPSPDQISSGHDLRCLSVMQHYEIPTRLLDWTGNFWIALYFACSGDPNDNAELWYYKREIFAAQRNMDPNLMPLVDASRDPPNEPFMLGAEKAIIAELDPKVTPRMRSQLAHHTVSTDVFSDHAALLHKLGVEAFTREGPSWFDRIIIDGSCKPKALQFLTDSLNINAGTIFPDVVGLGRFLRWQFDSLRTMML